MKHVNYCNYSGPGDRYPSDEPPVYECQKCGNEQESGEVCEKCESDEMERI